MFGIGYLERMQKRAGEERTIFTGNLDEELATTNKTKAENMEKLFYN